MRHPAAMGAFGRVAARTLVLIAAVIAALIFSTAANLTATARGAAPLKAVIIVGPTHNMTQTYLGWAEIIADVAENKGMQVARVYHPDATWSRVKQETTGANLVIYLGHGFGWPSPYPSNLFESQMDGFGLNYPDPDMRSENQVHYYGGEKVRRDLHFAENAIVIINHACYSSGQGEPGSSTPSQSIAVQRSDNFAHSFLVAGARTVFALEYQPAESIVRWLFTEHDTMDGIFRMRFNGASDSWGGWVGWNPTYHDSARTPGARILLDPHSQQGYRRAVTGDLEMTSDEWRGSADPSDITPPEVTSVAGLPSVGTWSPAEDPTVFTPNGDGLGDKLAIGYSVTEAAYLDFVIRDSADQAVRSFSIYTDGDGTTEWNGKDDAGIRVDEGRYVISATPRDVAGNVGLPVTTPVRVMKVMRAPAGTPSFFFARDGDGLAATSQLTVEITRDATLDWKIVDSSDNVVRTLMADTPVTAGSLSQTWDGRDDTGSFVPDGMYTQVLRSMTEDGTYSHRTSLRVMPFKVTAPRWSGPAGTTVKFTMNSAEAISGWPTIYVFQPGLQKFRVGPVRYSSKKFTFTVTFRSGGSPGQVQIKMTGTDTGGGTQTGSVYFTLE